MKNQIILFITLLVYASCQQKESKVEQKESQAISLKFTEKVNGYTVTGIFKPATYRNEYSGIQGPAILTFKKENEEFTVIHNLYTIHIDEKDFEVDKNTQTIKSINIKEVTDSLKKEMDEFFQDKSEGYQNFIFVDANFDGNKDLVLIEGRFGNKTETDYKFILSDGNGFDGILKGNDIDVEEPLTMITEVAKFDRVKKEITVPNDAEDYFSGSKTFKVIPKDFGTSYPSFRLVKQEKGQEN